MLMTNSTWLDEKYVNLLSFRLERFKKLNKSQYNFRCPLCGDSKKSKSKARGYVFEHKGHLWYKCHNCNRSMRFKYLLKEIDQPLFEEYSMERMREMGGGIKDKPVVFEHQIEKFDRRRKDKFEPLKTLKKISQLPETHRAKRYIVDRKIPPETHHAIYWCPKFYAWVNHYIPGKFSESSLSKDEGRIVFPFIDQNGYVTAATGRSLSPDGLRYVTVKFQEDAPKVFGLDRIDFTKEVLVVEGPIDSLFLPNCLALAGSSSDLSSLPLRRDTVFVFDNEPRNRDICRQIESYIDAGKRVCIFEGVEYKDINEMVMAGMTRRAILDLIHNSTHHGLQAKLAFNRWKKI